MNKHSFIPAALALAIIASASPALALGANLGASAQLGVGASSTGTRAEIKAQIMGDREAKAKTRGDNEIDRRITILTDLDAKVADMAKVSAAGKASVDAMVKAQISALTSLKATIDADSSTSTLKADLQSITQSYRIFMLVVPQGHIAITADKIHTAIDTMSALSAKISARLSEAAGTGIDVSASQAALADAATKLADAGTQADAAVSMTASLKPDNGDASIAASNKTALQGARAKLQAAMKDLQAARADLKTAVEGVKKINASASATASTSASTH